MSDQFITFGAPHITDHEISEVLDCMSTGWLGTGPRVEHFETRFSAYKKVNRSLVAAVNSCTAALHVSLIAANIGPGDEVITTPLTFCATVNAIIHAGATPVLADVNPHTFNIELNEIKKMVTAKTKAVVPVHFAGRPCEIEEICEFSKLRGLTVIEDCAHAIETETNGKKAGTFGDFGCFSFYVTKNIATGEGGMVIGKNQDNIDKVKRLALHGMSKDAWNRFGDDGYKHYQVVECGFKYNMMDIQAAIGIPQLERVDTNWSRRENIWQRYQAAFENLPITRPLEPEVGTRHGYHLYTLLIDESRCGIDRDEILQRMTKLGVGVGVHYMSIPEHPFYQQKFKWNSNDYPNAKKIGQQTVSIPISPKLSDEEVAKVIHAVSRSLDHASYDRAA